MQIALGIALIAATSIAGCSSNNSDPCGEPIYQGDATDEAWRALVDARATARQNDPNAPVITLPTEGQAFPASASAPRFTWTSPIAAVSTRSGTRWARSQATKAHPSCHRRGSKGLLSFLIGTASAHEPPITGDIYLVEIQIPGRTCPVSLITTNLEWQLDNDAWTLLKAATNQPITVTILSAYLMENRITEGPFSSAGTRTFFVR